MDRMRSSHSTSRRSLGDEDSAKVMEQFKFLQVSGDKNEVEQLAKVLMETVGISASEDDERLEALTNKLKAMTGLSDPLP